MLDDEGGGGSVSGPITVTAVLERPELVTFVDRVIVPALVERFLAEHTVRRPERHPPLATPKDAA